MNLFIRPLLSVALAFTLQSFAQSVATQNRYSPSSFQGSWHWEYHLTNADLRDSDTERLKRWAEGMDIRKTPYESLHIDLVQRGNKLTGECSSAMRFIDKVDGGKFSARIKGEVAQFTIESSHGSRVTIRLTRQRNRLYWEIIKTEGEGEYWFPDKAVLYRTQRRSSAKPGMPNNRVQRSAASELLNDLPVLRAAPADAGR